MEQIVFRFRILPNSLAYFRAALAAERLPFLGNTARGTLAVELLQVVLAQEALILLKKTQLPLSRWSVSDLSRYAQSCGLVASISESTIYRWLHQDALYPALAVSLVYLSGRSSVCTKGRSNPGSVSSSLELTPICECVARVSGSCWILHRTFSRNSIKQLSGKV